jgi:Putative auto-transporter adhesin, head GIN domain
MCKIAIILIAAFIVIAGCSQPGIKGDGAIKTEDRSISGFSKVEVSGGYKVKWSPGKPALNISADQNLLPLIKTIVSGDTLRIDSEEKLAPAKNIVITLSSVSLTRAQLAGGIDFKASHLFGQALKFETTGASDISVEGSVTELEANLTGASHLNAKSLSAQDVKLSLLGASDADVVATDTLKVSITGAGSVTYSGHPKSVEQNITGAGSVRRR